MFYLSLNRNKKSVTLDLGTPLGREAFYDLVKASDVVWDNFRPGVMERLGADYETIKKLNPKIISCSISGYGSTGPYMDRPSYDVVIQGMSGLMSITGEPGRPPVRAGFPAADILGGMFGALAVISALLKREHTGEGQRIDISLLDSMLATMVYEFSYYFRSGIVPKPQGSGHIAIVPYRAYKCKEGYIIIGTSWPRLAKVIGAEWMINDPRFKEREERLAHREEFDRIVEEYLAKASAEDWLELFYTEDVPAGPVNTLNEVVADPQVQNRDMILNLPHPLGDKIRLMGNPFKMADIELSKYTAPPLEGQHSNEILRDWLGYPEEKIKRLREEEEKHRDELIARLQKTDKDAAARLLNRKAGEDKKQ